MNRQFSPFAELSGADKQIRWLEYQSVRLPYISTNIDDKKDQLEPEHTKESPKLQYANKVSASSERPQPPPEVPRTLPHDFQHTQHRQYDAVIARMKQAELQAKRQPPQTNTLL